jgi:phosphatidylserine/phosphatidylglycerophosphate/cardiolipin synthase-like enzyme
MNTPFFSQIASQIILELEKAKSEILIAVAWFTNTVLFEIVQNMQKEGVKTEVMISDDGHNFGKLHFEHLVRIGGQVWVKETNNYALMHNKYCVIDQKTLVTGSYNWSVKAEKNFENIFVTDDPTAVSRYHNHFHKVLKSGGFSPYMSTPGIWKKTESALEANEDTRLFGLEQAFNDEADHNLQAGMQAGIKVNFDNVYEMIRRYTAVGAAKRLATYDNGEKIQSGLGQLWERNMLEISFERMILKQKYAELFNDQVKQIARKKLAKLNYTPPE